MFFYGKTFTIGGFFLFFILLLTGQALSGEQGRLVIDITDIPAAEGYAMIAVFDSEKAYQEGGEPAAKARVPVNGATARIVFQELVYGWYAVAVYHDKNGNGDLDTGVFGIPKEAYGHSNNVRGMFGPPAFNDIRFKVNGPETLVSITLK